MRLKIHILAFSLMLLPLLASAQKARLYTSENGLPNSQINSIYQDNWGLIWIATENGLSRFDGMEFSNFRSDRTDSSSLESDLVLGMFQDSHSTMWAATSNGLQIYDPLLSTFSKVDLQDSEVPQSSVYISSIAEIGDEIWVATSQHGVYVLDAVSHEIKSGRRRELSGLLPSSFINTIFRDSSGRVWLASETGGLAVVDVSGPSPKRTGEIWDSSTRRFSSDVLVTCFAENPDNGDILIGTYNYGILLFDSSEGKIFSLGHDASSCRVNCLLPNSLEGSPENSYLVGTENRGLKVLDTGSGTLSDISSPSIPLKMDNWKVHSLLEDNQGNIWIGAYDTGVLVIPESMYGFGYMSAAADPYSPNSGSCVTSILEDIDGSLWVGTDGSGLLHIGNDSRRSFTDVDNSALTNNSVLDIVMDRRGTKWIATYLDGLFSMDSRGHVTKFPHSADIGTARTARLLYDPERDYLFVGTYGNGFSVVSLPDGKVLSTVSEDRCKWVSSLHLDSEGMVWVGTFNGPLRYNPETGRLTSHDIVHSRVYSILEDSSKTMWFGTGEGLVKYDPSNGESVTYTENNGLSSNVISGILEDNGGRLWISTSYGLTSLDPENGTFARYYSYDGLQENEFRYGSAFKDKVGKLFFGGINGITSFNPQSGKTSSHPMSDVFFTGLTVMNRKVDFSSEGSRYLDAPITDAKRITLPYNSGTFSIGFAVPEYTNPHKVVFSYMMDGVDNDWNRTTATSNTANYTRIPSGKHNFTVKAFFDGDESNFSQKSIEVRILPPWYLSPEAFIFYILAILGLAQLTRGYFLRKHQQEQQAEESEIKEMKLRMFTNISHEIRTPLTLVLSPLKKLREAEEDPHRKDLYNLMYRNGLRINRLVNQLMDMRKIDDGQMPMHFRPTDIVYFTKDIMQTFGNLASDKNISFTIDSEQDELEVWIDQGNFDKVIFNLLSNAFKHTPDGGEIDLSIGSPEVNNGILSKDIAKFIRIGIFNSGSHIDDKYLEKVFERFFQADVMDAKVGSGVGLSLTKQLVELHHGKIKAENVGDEGVTFTVFLPLGNEHLSEEEMSRTTHHKDLYTKNIEDIAASTEDISYTPEDIATKNVKSKKNVVIVDDDAEIRSYIGMEMTDRYNVKTFPSADEAWAYISTNVPDIVISDLLMEGTDGAQLCSKIKHNPGTNHIPVIILTSSADEESIKRCTECGADRYFTKPISMDLLRSVVGSTLNNLDMIRSKLTNPVEYDFTEIKISSATKDLPKKVIDIITAHIEEPDFSVEDLSREIGMSRVHMNRKLKETMGMSPSNLIKSIRLRQAAYLLIHDKVNISEVAYRVGFSTHSYFSSSFHDYYGMSPKEFVAKYLGCTDEKTLEKLFNWTPGKDQE
ncbi:MAG: response regulator [Bacteroidales bacterium]|nr:response regulator [Bacteroidales bacterium]